MANSEEVGTVEGLFGPQTVERVRGRGRPAHVWSRQNSLRICNLFACGHSVETVAKVVGVSQPTLRKVYFSELAQREVMALKVRSEQMVRLTEMATAEGGNVAAEKALAGMIQAEQNKLVGERMSAADRKAADKPKGVKAERRDAAWTAGIDDPAWGDLIGPTLRPN